MPSTVVELGGLQTETRNPRSTTIDKVSTEEICRILHREDCRVPAAVEPCLPQIAGAIDALSERVRKGGRVFYIGAGTSGRYVHSDQNNFEMKKPHCPEPTGLATSSTRTVLGSGS